MADQVDVASDLEALELQSMLNLQRKRREDVVKANGFCLYCETPLSDGLRWCDAECRDEWEYVNKKRF